MDFFEGYSWNRAFDLEQLRILVSQFYTSVAITIQRVELYFISYYFSLPEIDAAFLSEFRLVIRNQLSAVLIQMEQARLGDTTAIVDLDVKVELSGYQLMIYKYFINLGFSQGTS